MTAIKQKMSLIQMTVYSKLVHYVYEYEKTSFEEQYNTEVPVMETTEDIKEQIGKCQSLGATDHMFYWVLLGLHELSKEEDKAKYVEITG